MDTFNNLRMSVLETPRVPVAESELVQFADRLDQFFTDLLRSMTELPVPAVALVTVNNPQT